MFIASCRFVDIAHYKILSYLNAKTLLFILLAICDRYFFLLRRHAQVVEDERIKIRRLLN